MVNLHAHSDNAAFLNLPHANWVARVLTMLIAVVGRKSLLGQILQQTRSEITSIARDAKPAVTAGAFSNN